MAESKSRDHAVVAEALDREFYHFFYGDVARSGLDPVAHYLAQGWRELRDPAPWFSTHFYLDTHADVAAADVNPLVHYLTVGRAQGRAIRPSHLGQNKTAPSAKGAAKQPSGLVTTSKVGQRPATERDVLARHFDARHYLSQLPPAARKIDDPLGHFMLTGWKQGSDPSPDFSTTFYLDAYPDVRKSGLNPFWHYLAWGVKEGRQPLPYRSRIQRMTFAPFVSVVVPNYNHVRFIEQRLQSILEQTYTRFEIILLDDGSTDGSRELLADYARRYPQLIRCAFNDANTGNVFAQWRKGLEEAAGDLVWICESDDFCAPDFLEKVIQPFRDESVMLSFGRIQFADARGLPAEGLDHYREEAEAGIWDAPLVRPAALWFRGAFAVSNVIPNAGGCVFRRQHLPGPVWDEALAYRICGDWYLYAMLSGGGQIAYVPDAVSYFRQHRSNTSGVPSRGADYYREHERLITVFRTRWGTPDDVAVRCYQKVYEQYELADGRKSVGPLANYFSNDRVLATEKSTRHILIGFLGFTLGGAELFPIHLANELVKRGHIVSMLRLGSPGENPKVRAMLDPSVAVYDAEAVRDMGVDAFVERAGIDLIHSHNAGVEFFFFDDNQLSTRVPYVVSLHGSYEVTPIPEPMLLRLLRGVSHWVYLTEKNLKHLDGIPIDPAVITHIPNGMPADDRPFERSRADLGIADDALVFAISSRAIPEKGWQAAAEATLIASRRSGKLMHLLLCGSGPEEERLRARYATCPNIHLLGFTDNVNGLYRLADVVMLPSRFKGESFPLSLVQALQVGKPIIASDLGAIKSMIQPTEAMKAGILVPFEEDELEFTESLAEAMMLMRDSARREPLAAAATQLGRSYGMDVVGARYEQIFRGLVPGWGGVPAAFAAASRAERQAFAPAPGSAQPEAAPLAAVSIDAIIAAVADGRIGSRRR